MIKTWLKHKIYEQCIDVMFTELYMNWLVPNIIQKTVTTKWTINWNNEFGEGGKAFMTRLQEESTAEIDNEIINRIRKATFMIKFSEH